MMNFARKNFDGLPDDQNERQRRFTDLTKNRAEEAGQDRYAGAHSCSPDIARGYYGKLRAQDIFDDLDLRARLLRLFVEMARFLASYPAPGAIELFNEPPFDLTREQLFGEVVQELKRGIRDSDPRLAGLPILSGTAFLERKVIAVISKVNEPFIAVHSYFNFRDPAAAEKKVMGMIAFLRDIRPARAPIVVAEAGSAQPLSREQNQKMVQILLSLAASERIGIWVWSTYIPASADHIDYAWVFNARSLAGGAFRAFFIDDAAERRYSTGRTVSVHDTRAKSDRSKTMSIVRIPTQAGRGFRFHSGHRSDLKPATIPR